MDARLEGVEAEAFASLAESAGLPVLRIAGGVCTAAPIAPANSLLNRVNGVADASDDELAEIAAFYRANGVDRYIVAPPQPELADRLRARGFELRNRWMTFRRDVAAPPPSASTALQIETARGDEFAAIVGPVSGMPADVSALFGSLVGRDGWHCLVACDGTEAVACGALFAHEGAGWLGAAGTLPAHRGKGAQGALLAARIALAQELDLDVLTTETGERRDDASDISYRNILRAGFEEAYLRPNLVSPES
jgi:GNAT superfamily N-acetyltransferase